MSERISEALADFCSAIEAAAFDLKRRIGQLHGVGLKEETFSSLLGWTESKGKKLGEFEWCSREANNNSDAFRHAMNILKANDATIKNQLKEDDWHCCYWYYEDRIFRRLRKGKAPTKEQTQTSKMQEVRGLFPSDLATILAFEETEEFVLIKPRQYLGSENFSKIATIVRDAGGEYISAGKESHFRIRK